jgi:hypothetical protein
MHQNDHTGNLKRALLQGSWLSRRAWLSGALLGWTAGSRLSESAESFGQVPDKGDKAEVEQIQAAARKAGLGVFARDQTEHFLGLGNAPARYLAAALGLCENLARVFLAYFRAHGFNLALPRRRMIVIALEDDASYAKFSGEDPGQEIGGHYDLDTNRLVVFDFGSRQAALDADAKRVNVFTLVHETAHLLSFNSGLLSRKADVPLCVSEGLATFVELWRPKGRSVLGVTNRPRLQALLNAGKDAEPWIPIAEILADDKPFDDPKRQQLAYAESWLFAHYLLKTRDKLPKFQAYLAGLPALGPGGNRIKFAEAQLGSLEKLDSELKRHGKRELQ